MSRIQSDAQRAVDNISAAFGSLPTGKQAADGITRAFSPETEEHPMVQIEEFNEHRFRIGDEVIVGGNEIARQDSFDGVSDER